MEPRCPTDGFSPPPDPWVRLPGASQMPAKSLKKARSRLTAAPIQVMRAAPSDMEAFLSALREMAWRSNAPTMMMPCTISGRMISTCGKRAQHRRACRAHEPRPPSVGKIRGAGPPGSNECTSSASPVAPSQTLLPLQSRPPTRARGYGYGCGPRALAPAKQREGAPWCESAGVPSGPRPKSPAARSRPATRAGASGSCVTSATATLRDLGCDAARRRP